MGFNDPIFNQRFVVKCAPQGYFVMDKVQNKAISEPGLSYQAARDLCSKLTREARKTRR